MLVPFLSVSYFHYDEFSSYMKISNNSSSSCTSCGSATPIVLSSIVLARPVVPAQAAVGVEINKRSF